MAVHPRRAKMVVNSRALMSYTKRGGKRETDCEGNTNDARTVLVDISNGQSGVMAGQCVYHVKKQRCVVIDAFNLRHTV